MSIQRLAKLSQEELYQASAVNFNSLILATIEYLKQHQLSILEYVHFVGARFAPQWKANLTTLQVAEGMAVNFMSVGAKIEELAGNENEAYFVMTGWLPAKDLLRYSGKEEEADQYIEVIRPIAEHQNCSFEMERQDVRVICTFRRKGS